MPDITDHGRSTIAALSQTHGLSPQAVEQMARAIQRGGGTMAQFDIPELGGSGQWMAGGMTMVGDMFNNSLKARVESLCNDLNFAMSSGPLFRAPARFGGSDWWPAELGHPASVGGQNQVRYAYFPQACRIAFDPGYGGQVILLDTLDHQIGGFGQQQSGPGDPFAGISFSSQRGQFALSSLPQVHAGGPASVTRSEPVAEATAPEATPVQPPSPVQPAAPEFAPQSTPVVSPLDAPAAGQHDPFDLLEKLGKLRDAGVLTDEEFDRKKAEILARI